MRIIFLLIYLAGCDFIPQPSSETLLKKGWAEQETFKKKSYYCYSTLGEPMCYKHPLPNSQTRLTGQPYIYEKEKSKKFLPTKRKFF